MAFKTFLKRHAFARQHVHHFGMKKLVLSSAKSYDELHYI